MVLPVQAKSDTKRQIVAFKDNVDSKLSTDEGVRIIEEDLAISFEGNTDKKDKKSDDQLPEQPTETIPWEVEYMNNLSPNATNTGNGIKDGIIDTGIDVDHLDLIDNIKGGYNATSKKKSFDDDNGHGTHVAGIIAAVDNDIGVIGVIGDANEADLYAIKVLDEYGNGYISDIVEVLGCQALFLGLWSCLASEVNRALTYRYNY